MASMPWPPLNRALLFYPAFMGIRRAAPGLILTFVQPALSFQAKEARFFLRHPRLPFARGVGISYRQIALIPKRMIFQAVLLQILVNRAVIPVDDRQHLKHATLDRQHR